MCVCVCVCVCVVYVCVSHLQAHSIPNFSMTCTWGARLCVCMMCMCTCVYVCLFVFLFIIFLFVLLSQECNLPGFTSCITIHPPRDSKSLTHVFIVMNDRAKKQLKESRYSLRYIDEHALNGFPLFNLVKGDRH